MKAWSAAVLTFLAMITPALAQSIEETQAPVPIGGSDRRTLPNRSRLPPMFGSNLFLRGGVGVALQPKASPSALPREGQTSSAAGALGQATTAASALGDGATHDGLSQILAQTAAGIVTTGAGQSSTISATSVQPTGGAAAYDPNHVMAPGDVIQVHIYGATTLDQQATVDGNGDIFLPSVGPVHVGGITASQLQTVIGQAVGRLYHANARVYTTLASAVPVYAFVTGAVISPGEYSLSSTASVISYLQAAGGIDPDRGSYRDIEILRDGRVIAHVDLYRFLLDGRLPPVRLRDRDTILVGAQGPTVAAEGDVSGVFRYELTRPYTGEQLITLARPYPDATRVNLVGVRNGRPEAYSYSLNEFRRVSVKDGDVITFAADTPTKVMTVTIEGRINGPTTLVVSRRTTLMDLLPYIGINPYFSDTSSIYIRRVSVAQAQKKAIRDSLHRLEQAVVTSPTVTSEQATMRKEEAQIIFQFAAQLTNVSPEGRLIVEHNGRLSNVRLESGDVVVIPSRTDLVLISGEVRVPQAAVWVRGANVEHYINAAGGFTERANDSRILVIRQSGQTLVGSNPPVLPGDHVIILPSPSNFTLPFIKDITQILYQITVATGVALKL